VRFCQSACALPELDLESVATELASAYGGETRVGAENDGSTVSQAAMWARHGSQSMADVSRYVSEGDPVTIVVGLLEPLFVRGLADVLREDSGVDILDSGLEDSALERVIVRQAPQVAILGEATAYSGLRYLRAIQPRTGLLILAHDPLHAYGMRVLASGASCLARSASPADLLGAVHLTAQGTRVFVSSGRYPSPTLLVTLTMRETQVAQLLSEGLSNPEIARALHISVETARTHVAAILRKLNVQSRRELLGMLIPSPASAAG
jgi:DNA-binding NarL/FixJ family response regulator